MKKYVRKLDKAGRIILPAKYRRRIGITPGDEVEIVEEEGQLRIRKIYPAEGAHVPLSSDAVRPLLHSGMECFPNGGK